MLNTLRLFVDEIIKTLKKPSRFLGLFRKDSWIGFKNYFFRKRLTIKYQERWCNKPKHNGIKVRIYDSYEDYVDHQKAKLSLIDLTKYDAEFRKVLRNRLEKLPQLKKGMSVLCLAARIGTEVKAFHDFGCFAVGVDLNPGENNYFVLPGDFHNLRFPDNSIDVIYSNSLDHALLIEQVVAEINRTLKPNGFLILEMMDGLLKDNAPDEFESLFWSKKEDLLVLFNEVGLKTVARESFVFPWTGEQILMIKGSG